MGYSKVISLGTGTSFDVSSYEGYNNFTGDNFIIEIAESSSCSINAGGNKGFDGDRTSPTTSTTFTKEYDDGTGILNAYVKTSIWATNNYSELRQNDLVLNVKAYLIY